MTIALWMILAADHIRKNVRVHTGETSTGQIPQPLLLEYRPGVAALALTQQQKLLLIRRYRHGLRPVIWEWPGSAGSAGGTPMRTARREPVDETRPEGCHFPRTSRVASGQAAISIRPYAFGGRARLERIV